LDEPIGLPDGSFRTIWLPPGPVMMSLREWEAGAAQAGNPGAAGRDGLAA
jgi:hypothetical protein